jgi:hypothetical protein
MTGGTTPAVPSPETPRERVFKTARRAFDLA